MTERIVMQVKGGIDGLRLHEKVMPGRYAKVSDVLAAVDEAERWARLDGILIGMWIAFTIHALVWAIIESIG